MVEVFVIAILCLAIVGLEVAHLYTVKSIIKGFLSRNVSEYTKEDSRQIVNPESKAEKIKKDWRNPNKGVNEG